VTTSPAPAPPAVPRALKSLPGPRPLPVLGNLLKLGPPTLHLQLEEWARTYGEAYCCYFGRRPALVVSHPEVVRKALLERPATFRRPRNLEKATKSLRMNGVLTAEGDDWRRQRKLLNLGFSPPNLETFFPSMVTITQRLAGVLEREGRQGAPVDILSVLMRYTVDVTSIISFGMDLNTLEQGSHPLQRYLEQFLPALNQRLLAPFPYWKLLPSARRMEHAVAETRKAIQELVDSTRRTLEREPERAAKPRNMLEAMLVARDEEGGGARFTDDEIFANVLTLLVGGEDTTANTLAWMLYYVASMPAVQARARQEVDAVVGPELAPTLAQLRQLPYLAGVAQETLRLRSTVPFIFLETLEDAVVGDVAVPKGTLVLGLTRLSCLAETHFGDAKGFRPERWLSEPPPDTQPHSPRQLLSFGSGGRVCPGRNLALMECALAPCAVLRHLEVEVVDPSAPVHEVNAFSVGPVGIRLRFKPRASA
jgi:cytochrome P450